MKFLKKVSGFKVVVLFAVLKLIAFLYVVSLTRKSLIPKSKQNVLIDVSQTNEEFISNLFIYKSASIQRKLESQILPKKLNDKWYIYLLREQSNDANNFNEIKLELAQMGHKFHYEKQSTKSNDTQASSLNQLLEQFDENDFIVLKLDILNQSDLDLIFSLIKTNQLSLIDHIYMNYKFDCEHKKFLSQMFKYTKINEIY